MGLVLSNQNIVVYCDDNGCKPQKPMSSLASFPSLMITTDTVFPVQTNFHEAAAAQATSNVSENTSSNSSNLQIIVGSVGGIIGSALVAAAIFVVRHVRRKRPLSEEEGTGDSSTDNAEQSKGSPKVEAAEQEKSTDNQRKAANNVRHIETVCVIPMDDAKNSLLNREWKQLMKAAYQQGWYNKPREQAQDKKDSKAAINRDASKKGSSMAQEEAFSQEEVCSKEGACNQEEDLFQGKQFTDRVSRGLDAVKYTPNRLPSTTIDRVPYLRSQSAPNLRWLRTRHSILLSAELPKPDPDLLLNSSFQEIVDVDLGAMSSLPWLTMPNAFDCPQQAILLGENNNSTEEQDLGLVRERNKEDRSTEGPQKVAKEEANKESLIRRFIRETENFEQVELSPSVAELIEQCKVPVGRPKNFREMCVPVHFRIYGLERMEREKVKIEEINKLVPYVFDGPNKHHYPAQYHYILEKDVQRIKNRGKEPVNEQPPAQPIKSKKLFSFAFWRKKPAKKTKKFTTAMIRRTDISSDDSNIDCASPSFKDGEDTQQNKQVANRLYGSSLQTDIEATETIQSTQKIVTFSQVSNAIDLSEAPRLQENEMSWQVIDRNADTQPTSHVWADVSGPESSSQNKHLTGAINTDITKDAMTHTSTECGPSSVSGSIKHYEDAVPYTVRRLFIPPLNN